MSLLSESFVSGLVESPNYRSFLKKFFSGSKGADANKVYTYAEVSRRAGFSSRAYIRDIVEGHKRVGPGNFDRIADGLKLTGALREYFRALASREEVSLVRRSPKSLDQLKSEILKTNRSSDQRLGSKIPAQAGEHFGVIPSIFAASGDTDVGATFDEIKMRTRLHGTRLRPALDRMTELGLLVERGNRFVPCHSHVALDLLGGDVHFRADFERSLNLARQRFGFQARTQKALFFSSTVCVNSGDLPRLRNELRKTLLEFVNSAENSKGDVVVDLVTALSTNDPTAHDSNSSLVKTRPD